MAARSQISVHLMQDLGTTEDLGCMVVQSSSLIILIIIVYVGIARSLTLQIWKDYHSRPMFEFLTEYGDGSV